jgi:hypothetical protein
VLLLPVNVTPVNLLSREVMQGPLAFGIGEHGLCMVV